MSLPTQNALSDDLLAGLGNYVEVRFGLYFPRERWRDLERGVHAASVECGGNPGWYAERLLSSTASPAEIEALTSHLTVSETYFFRETRGLWILERQIVPNTEDRRLRVWSAGCATGEEPYSIAMLLRRIIPDLSRWDISILATDLNTRSLEKAREGIYGEWSFRGVPDWVRAACFLQSPDGRWAIDPSIKRMVRISYANLVRGALPDSLSAMDVIFCCNVLMYLSPDAARKVVRQLHCCLRPGGWLIVAPAEVSHTLFREFEQVALPDGTAYRRPAAPTGEPVFYEPAAPPRAEPVFLESAYANSAPEDAEKNVPDIPRPPRNRMPAMVRLSRACANRGNLREAFRWCEIAIATGKADARVHYLRAAILEEQGSLDEAARSLRRALYLEPRFAMGHFALGNLAARRGRRKESAKHFENTIVLLTTYQPSDILPESGGLTAGRLKELITRRTNG